MKIFLFLPLCASIIFLMPITSSVMDNCNTIVKLVNIPETLPMNLDKIVAPANDEPCHATSITVGTFSATTIGATTTSNPEVTSICNSTPSRDVWFKSNILSNGILSISTTLVGGTNTPGAQIALYSTGSCSSLFYTNICSNGEEIVISGVVGQEVFIRVWVSISSVGSSFNIILRNFNATPTIIRTFPLPISLIPDNDNPCNATSLEVSRTCNNLSGNTTEATTTTNPSQQSLCGSSASKDVWYTAKIPASRVMTINIRLNNPFSVESRTALYKGACTSLTNTNICSSIQDFAISGEPGTIVFIRVWLVRKLTHSKTSGSFNICVLNFNNTSFNAKPLPGTQPAPVNDEPGSATDLTTGTICTNINATTVDATTTGNPEAIAICGSVPSRDVWFKVKMPSSGVMTITTVATTSLMPGTTIALYAGTLGSLSNTGLCSSNQSLAVSGTSGRVVFIRVWGNSATGGPFTICAKDSGSNPTPLPF